jgi:hypothetical protein
METKMSTFIPCQYLCNATAPASVLQDLVRCYVAHCLRCLKCVRDNFVNHLLCTSIVVHSLYLTV